MALASIALVVALDAVPAGAPLVLFVLAVAVMAAGVGVRHGLRRNEERLRLAMQHEPAPAQEQRSHAFLSSILENIPLMVFVKDAEDLRFVLFNKAGEDLLGRPREELIGRSDYDFFPAHEAEFFTSKDRDVLANGDLVDIPEETINTPSGERILHTRKIPLLDEAGKPAYLLGISEDITERRRTEKLARQAKEEADRANRAKSEFLSRMSHELRTPLNAVIGFGQLLEMDELSPLQRDNVGLILKGGRHLLELINEVLDISRIESGNMSISLEGVHVGDALSHVLDLVKPLAGERDVSLERPSAETADRYVLADAQRLNQVLLNLLSNAIKYNREGGSVTVSLENVSPRHLLILVTDTGKGISEEQLAKIFMPFERLGAEQTAIEGTGLGLTVSKLLVESMGGSLAVESQPWIGTTFSVKLPLTEAPCEDPAPVAAREPSTNGLSPNGSSWPTRTILHVEDNLSNFRLVEQILSSRPELKLLTAMQGNLGLELAQRHHPDLILLDLHLPGMQGDEVLRALKNDPATREIPVVLVSADATAGQIDRLLEAGACAYLTKPLDVKAFLAVVDRQLDALARM